MAMPSAPNQVLYFFEANFGAHDLSFGLRPPAIECFDCSSAWCIHCQELYHDNRDSIPIWYHSPENVQVQEQLNLHIPIFPSDGWWIEVMLTRTELIDSVVYAVNWTDAPNMHDAFICHLSPGEGRKVIRESILQYWQADIKARKSCTAAHHGPYAESNIRERTPNESYYELWAIYTTGWCMTCTASFDQTDSDLVPSPEKNVWSN